MKKIWLILGIAAGVLTISLIVFLNLKTKNPSPTSTGVPTTSSTEKNNGKTNVFSQNLSGGKCQGSGTVTLSHLPMDIGDIGNVQPYGIMVGAHVIPTSHGYFGPADFQSARDAYPVYAIADGYIVNYSHRSGGVGDNQDPNHVTDEYQMWFEHSCTFYTYYDLLTSVEPSLLTQLGGKLSGFDNKNVRVPVKAGQLVGRVGEQTVDFGVWNFEKEPAYFANPKSYEENRPYLEDMFKFFAPDLKAQLLTKAVRKAEPQSGIVNYDIDGKLVGGWFQEGTGGFMGPPSIQGVAGGRYWDGHLAIAYDYIDPTSIKFSIGNWPTGASQFAVKGNAPDPATIGVDSGPIKYELMSGNYVNGDTGQGWLFEKPITKPQFKPNGPIQGTALLQMTASDKLKVEIFPGKTASQVKEFTTNAKLYER